ncbi:hypothetical protein GCM10008018_66220 [Paenibacillus marchantiophytorum]|uniref:XRE family transcriptional regulator n=1 Tax=Paenibacillus marchantiophytorum TaxID=1619310 RepID=A0ABQ1FH56_9BACL|nr:hypothetical protein GCM10008018_66220 [Paenibacillus marchantiophytorum]
MEEKDMYVIKRRKKRIRLVRLAEAIACSPSLLSKYENSFAEMSESKIIKYREFIDSV